MKCTKCQQEIESGSIYCKNCKAMAQLVPDYNVLEEDFLTSIIDDKKVEDEVPEELHNQILDIKDENENTINKRKTYFKKPESFYDFMHNKTFLHFRVLLFAAIAIILICAITFPVIGSYSYQMNFAKSSDKKMDYESAIFHYENAMDRDSSKVEPILGAAIDYYKIGNYKKSVSLLKKVIKLDPDNMSAYKYLFSAYVKTGNFDELLAYDNKNTSKDILDLIDEVAVFPPSFTVEGGDFSDDIKIGIESFSQKIYYTTDGSNPTTNGKLYRGNDILLKEGNNVVKAVCKNSKGSYSQVITAVYNIVYGPPDFPKVSPKKGTFYEETFVTIESDEGNEIYYTWDGKDPDLKSEKYTEPIPVIEGNNVLSILVVSPHGFKSDIYRCNFTYYKNDVEEVIDENNNI